MRASRLALAVGLLVLPGAAHAHFDLLTPPPSSTTSASLTGGGKGVPPCGPDTTSTVVTPVQGGHPLPVKLNETVMHPGFYRFALSINSRSELPLDNVVRDKDGKVLSPTGMPTGTSATAEYQTKPVFPVLADNLFPHTTGAAPLAFTGEVMLPNVTCAKCTLQVIEFMAEHPPNGAAGYFYHHCADLKITADPNLPIFNPNAAGGGSGGGGGSNGGASNGGGSNGGASNGGASGNVASGGSQPIAGGASGNTAGGAANGGEAPASAGAPPAGGSAGAVGLGGALNSAGSSAAGANSAGATSAGATSTGDNPDEGGCSVSHGPASSTPLLAVGLGLLLAGARRRRRGR